MSSSSFIRRLPERLMGLVSDRGYRRYVFWKLRQKTGYVEENWTRMVMNAELTRFLSSLPCEELEVAEVSPGQRQTWSTRKFKSYTPLQYPDYDICNMEDDLEFDLMIADNVFEHVRYPWRAARNVFRMLRPGGYFVIATPFLIRVHREPTDFYRWTEDGLRALLEDAGFDQGDIRSGSWGNRACIVANFDRWRPTAWRRNFRNEPNLPVLVWAIARKRAVG